METIAMKGLQLQVSVDQKECLSASLSKPFAAYRSEMKKFFLEESIGGLEKLNYLRIITSNPEIVRISEEQCNRVLFDSDSKNLTFELERKEIEKILRIFQSSVIEVDTPSSNETSDLSKNKTVADPPALGTPLQKKSPPLPTVNTSRLNKVLKGIFQALFGATIILPLLTALIGKIVKSQNAVNLSLESLRLFFLWMSLLEMALNTIILSPLTFVVIPLMYLWIKSILDLRKKGWGEKEKQNLIKFVRYYVDVVKGIGVLFKNVFEKSVAATNEIEDSDVNSFSYNITTGFLAIDFNGVARNVLSLMLVVGVLSPLGLKFSLAPLCIFQGILTIGISIAKIIKAKENLKTPNLLEVERKAFELDRKTSWVYLGVGFLWIAFAALQIGMALGLPGLSLPFQCMVFALVDVGFLSMSILFFTQQHYVLKNYIKPFEKHLEELDSALSQTGEGDFQEVKKILCKLLRTGYENNLSEILKEKEEENAQGIKERRGIILRKILSNEVAEELEGIANQEEVNINELKVLLLRMKHDIRRERIYYKLTEWIYGLLPILIIFLGMPYNAAGMTNPGINNPVNDFTQALGWIGINHLSAVGDDKRGIGAAISNALALKEDVKDFNAVYKVLKEKLNSDAPSDHEKTEIHNLLKQLDVTGDFIDRLPPDEQSPLREALILIRQGNDVNVNKLKTAFSQTIAEIEANKVQEVSGRPNVAAI